MRCLLPMSAVVVAAAVAIPFGPRIALASAPPPAFDQVADAWMSAIALLEHDDEDDDDEDEDEDEDEDDKRRRESGGMKRRGDYARGHGRGDHPHGGHGPRPGMAGMEGPRALMAKMDEIMARLGRIEAKLDGRPGAPMRGEWRGPRPEGPRPERPAVPEEVREQMRKRMEQGREQMEQARQKFREMEERISRLEAEIKRLKADR